MKPLRLKPKKTPNSEPFEFGHGDTQYSNLHAYLPTCFVNDTEKACLIGTCVIDSTNDIPLLGSNALLCKLQAVIDLPNREVHLQALGCSVGLATVNGHLSLQMTCFSSDVSKCEAWSVLSKKSDEKHADPELVLQLEPDDGRQEGSKARNQELRDLPVTSPTDANQTSYMAEAMETPGHELQVVREVSGGMHDAGSQAEDQGQRVAVASRPALHGGEEPVAGEVPGAMHSRPHSEVGKSTWQVQQVPGLRKEMEVERRSTSTGRPSSAKRALAAAFTVLVHSCVLPRPEVYPGEVHGSVDTTKDPSQSITVEHHEPTFAGAQNATNAYYTHAECAEKGGDSKVEEEGIPTKAGNGGGRDRDVQRELRVGSRGRSLNQKKGNQTWLCGYLKSVAKVYHKENEIYESLFTHADHVRGGCRVDVMEVFANRARVSELAPRLGLSASQPIDKEFDFDLMTSEGRKVLWRAVKRLRPLLILVAWPCTEWCITLGDRKCCRRKERSNSRWSRWEFPCASTRGSKGCSTWQKIHYVLPFGIKIRFHAFEIIQITMRFGAMPERMVLRHKMDTLCKRLTAG